MTCDTMLTIPFKRGDTFIVEGVVAIDNVTQDITDWGIRSQVRDSNRLVANLVLDKNDPTNGRYRLSFADTTAWPVKDLLCDIEYTLPSGQIASTETFAINCLPDITS